MLALGGKLGPVLWQLPPSLGYDPERLARFFAQLPRTTGEAAELAAGHDQRLEDRALTIARDVVVYFDNDVKVRAPVDVIALADRLGVAPPPAPEPQLRVRRR